MQQHPIRSFTRRQGKITASQKQALASLLSHYSLSLADGMANFEAVFGRPISISQSPLILEIGFGGGEALISMAQQFPEQNFIGIDVHGPGIGKVLAALKQQNLTNVRIYDADAIEVLEQCIPDASLARVILFFPDPWRKRRHHKRRIVQPHFLELLHRKLVSQGLFYLATDWEDYSVHMMEVLSASPYFSNLYGAGNFAPRAEFRPLTKFEKRGQALGHGVWDLVFERNC